MRTNTNMTNNNDFDMIKCSDLWVTKISEDTNMILSYMNIVVVQITVMVMRSAK